MVMEFLKDPEWAGKPFWALNLLQYKGDGAGKAKYEEYVKHMREEGLPSIGAKIVMWGYCRTVIGRKAYHAAGVVEYPSPEAVFKMASSKDQGERNKPRLEGLEELSRKFD